MARSRKSAFVVLSLLLVTTLALADVTTRGQIEGRVKAPDGVPIAGAEVALSGELVLGGPRSVTTEGDGRFRFVNLNPGAYRVHVALQGFASREYTVTVNVGKTATVEATLALEALSETVTVEASAPLFDQTSAAHGTNMAVEELQALPTGRDFSAVVDSAAGFNNQAAYGAGGNVASYDKFGFGAATNSYQLNGVSVSNLEYGNSWVTPNYDTIQEIQIVGPGGSAEYSSYSGAVVNVVTKAGTNELRGTTSAFYTNDDLTGDNSDGIRDLEPSILDRDAELSLTLGGPVIADKLHFFGALGYHDAAAAPARTDFYDQLSREQYQLRLDYVPTSRHIVSGMMNYEPISNEDLGLQAETGPETGYGREQETTSGFVSWMTSWNDSLISEVRYAGVSGSHDSIPNTMDKASVTDYATGINHNSRGIIESQENSRDEIRAVITNYVDDFMGGDHELKAGLEYEDASTRSTLETAENVIYSLIPIDVGITYVQAIVNYVVDQANDLKRPGIFLQDRATFGRATVTAGLRYDRPTTSDTNTGATLLEFDQFSPRLGLAFDINDDGRSVARAAVGRYYDKVPTYGIGSYAGTGLQPVSFYGAVLSGDIDPTNTALLHELVLRPENFSFEFFNSILPVEDDINGPKSDIFNIGFDQQFSPRTGLSVNYIYRETDDFIVMTQYANDVTYAPFEYTSDFTGETFTIWEVTGGGPREFALGNRDFNWQKTHMAVIELRSRPTDRLFIDTSLALERSRGTRDNNECAVLSLCSSGVDANPNFVENPYFTEGALSQERPWTFKVRGNWELPANFEAGWDFRWMAGRAYGASDYCFNIPGCNDPYTYTVPLEPRDARREDDAIVLNLRLAKRFAVGGLDGTLSFDALNLTNEMVDMTTYAILTNINDTYARESTETGETVSAFGRPGAAGTPRQFRLGVRFAF